MKRSNVVWLIVAILMAGCQPSQSSVETSIANTEVVKQTELAVVVLTMFPTETPLPTITPQPTKTPKPSATSTPIPSPVVLSGVGDNVVDLDWPYGVAIVEIIGNPSSRHFAVTSYTKDNEYIDLLVNTTEPYYGIRMIDLLEEDTVARFEINATGEWQITIKSFLEVKRIDVPGEYSSIGDDVFIVTGDGCNTARIKGNASSSHFAVIAYSYSEGRSLLVNTTDPYVGTVLCPDETLIFEILSPLEDWHISLE